MSIFPHSSYLMMSLEEHCRLLCRAGCCTRVRYLLDIQCASHTIYRLLERNCFPLISWRICAKNVRELQKKVCLLGSNLLFYLKSNSKYFMGFITYKRHIPHIYCQRVMLNVSSAAEGLTMDLLPGDKTPRNLQRQNGVRRFPSIHTPLLGTQRGESASAYQPWHAVLFCLLFVLQIMISFTVIGMTLLFK